jgi:hypothetical protein
MSSAEHSGFFAAACFSLQTAPDDRSRSIASFAMIAV